jgi:hypothetical protein
VFLRSPHAHAHINSISVPATTRGRVFTAADLQRIKPIRVITQAPGARSPPWPPLATDKVRYVGEAIAACVAPTRAEAEDLAATVRVDYRPLHAVMDALTECTSSAALVHEYFGNEERFSLDGATHGTLREGSAAGDRAGKRKTCWTKPLPQAPGLWAFNCLGSLCSVHDWGRSVRRVGTFRDIHRAFELSGEAAPDPCAAHRRADDRGGPSVPAPIWRAVLLCAICKVGVSS